MSLEGGSILRPLLPALILLALAGGAGVPAQAGAAPRYGDPLVSIAGLDLQTATIPQLQAAMTVGTITSRQLTQAYLNRIAFFDQGCVKVNAVRALTDDALAQADAADAARRQGRTGILLGIPILLKDNIDTVDADTTAGSIALAGNRPPKDAFLVTQLRAAGAVILGKTNLSEFANWMAYNMPNGYSSLGGQVLNPYDQGDPSGSSSGSGAGGTLAYAAGTFGTETSGSILGPSSADSMVGIKPTVGAVSRSGIIPLAHSYDTAGPIARDVTDAAILLSAVGATDSADSIFEPSSGGPPPDHDYYTGALDPHALQGKRIGYSKDDLDPNLGGLTTEQQVLYQQALTDLQAAGATLVPFDTLFFTSTGGLTELGGIFSEFKYGIADYLAHSAGPAGPGGRPILVSDDLTGIIVYNQQHPSQIPYGQDMLIASDATTGATQDDPSSVATILNAREAIDSAFSQNNLDAYVGPGVNYANIGAAAGYPSVQVPMGYTVNGTNPLGLQILGQAWTERKLIGLAYSYEQATHRRVPPTIADPALLSCKPVAAVAGTTSAPPAARVLPNTSEAPAPAGPMLVLLLPFIAAWGARIRHRARQRARERP